MLGMKLIAAILALMCARGSVEATALAKEGDQKRKIDLDGAIESYKKAVALEPENHRLHWKLASAYVTKEDWKNADTELANACARAPTFASYFFMRGFVLEQMKQWSDAKPLLEKAIALDPRYPDPEFDLAQVFLKLGDEQKALAHFTRAIELQPDSSIFYARLADLYIRLGYLDHAEKVLAASEPFVAKDDKHRWQLFTLGGQIAMEKKDITGAVTKYEQAKDACGTCTEAGQAIAYFNVGSAQALAKKKEGAANLIRFQKVVCKGAAAQRYADECMQSYELLKSLGPP